MLDILFLLAAGAVSRHWQWHGSFLEMSSALASLLILELFDV